MPLGKRKSPGAGMDKSALRAASQTRVTQMAERVGFEPTVPCGTPVFKTGALDRSATSPNHLRLASYNHLPRRCLDSLPVQVTLRFETECNCRSGNAICFARIAMRGKQIKRSFKMTT
jgi:hypothetical protein